MDEDLIKYLRKFTTERRCSIITEIANFRTRYLTVVIENIFQPQNASAVLRTCDCFGIQDVHIIENENKYTVNPDVVMGSDKWLTINKYNKKDNNTLETIKQLKQHGYRIVATSPHKTDQNLDDFDLEKGKAAFLFGTELNGLSYEAMEAADEYLKIPMVGFTESFNISVSAAIILHHLSGKLRKSNINWKLTASEIQKLELDWLKKSIKDSEGIINEYRRRFKIQRLNN